MKWFREARFGMFVHWGVHSCAAGIWNGQPIPSSGDWIQCLGRVSAEDYRNTLLGQFNPGKYRPETWVLAAKAAGMKYVVITAKHHDGFCLWDSKLTDWDVGATPYKSDLLKPLAEACRKHGLKFCLYYSIMDWSHPDYGTKASYRGNARNPNPDMDRYAGYVKGQLKELLGNYGDVGLLWFDGAWEDAWTHDRAADLYDYLRGLQPSLIINNRIDKNPFGAGALPAGFKGDYDTPEQKIPPNGFGPEITWETCMTMNDTWGFKANDNNWKTSAVLIRSLIDISGKGGNFLLNVGPTSEGEIPAPSLDRLADIAAWMKTNGESIHGTTASIFPKIAWDGSSTTRRMADGTTRIYLHLFSRPAQGKLIVRGLVNRPEQVTILGVPGACAVNGKPESWTIDLPEHGWNPLATVVALTVRGEPVARIPVNEPDERGVMILPAIDASLHGGGSLKLEQRDDRTNIGYWMERNSFVSWSVKIPAGNYRVTIDGSCESAGSEMKLQAGDVEMAFSVPCTGAWQNYRAIEAGTLTVPTDVSGDLSIHALSGSGPGFINIRSLTLTLARKP